MKVKYPNVKQDATKRVYVDFNHNNKRYRLFNGTKINSEIHPNSFPEAERVQMGHLLAAEVYKFLTSGLRIEQLQKSKLMRPNMTDKDYLTVALEQKLKSNYSDKYKEMLQHVYNCLCVSMSGHSINQNSIQKMLDNYRSGVSYNTLKRHLNVLLNEAVRLGMKENPMKDVASKKGKAKLHKPFDNIHEVLDEIKHFNHNLYICTLLTYGCLLRPHKEIRELTWGDFSENLSFINLNGSRNKSGKNRVVPVPSYIKNLLKETTKDANIFTNTTIPPNKDYFKTLWGRFKKQSKTLAPQQTLYSFRHTAAIDIFKRTGSITKLKQAMGHSSINVSLTYLRGLEVTELQESDMPSL